MSRRSLMALALGGCSLGLALPMDAGPTIRTRSLSWPTVYTQFHEVCIGSDPEAVRKRLEPSFQMYYKHETLVWPRDQVPTAPNRLALLLRTLERKIHVVKYDEHENPFLPGDAAAVYVVEAKASDSKTKFVDHWLEDSNGAFRLQKRWYPDKS